MSEPFKPGDKVRGPHLKEIEYTVFEATEIMWRTASSAWMLSENFELVEPSVPVSKIRKVFEQLDFSEPSARARRRLAAAFQMLTGEPLRKDAT